MFCPRGFSPVGVSRLNCVLRAGSQGSDVTWGVWKEETAKAKDRVLFRALAHHAQGPASRSKRKLNESNFPEPHTGMGCGESRRAYVCPRLCFAGHQNLCVITGDYDATGKDPHSVYTLGHFLLLRLTIKVQVSNY